jgi:AcrR family transcriptional regulator
MASPTRTRLSAEERRTAVVRAAVAAFARTGYAGTSTEEIASAAGISQPYLFRLFPTKKALFLAAVERCCERISTTFAEAAAGHEGEDGLQAMGRAYVDLLHDRELLLLQLQMYAACEDTEVRAATRDTFRRLWAQVEVATGRPVEELVSFFAAGMLCNVAAAMDLPGLDEPWAVAMTGAPCPEVE